MVDNEKEEKKERAFFKKTEQGAKKLLKEHKRYAGGGIISSEVKKVGRNMAKVINQTGHGYNFGSKKQRGRG
jgi:hypothetical protein